VKLKLAVKIEDGRRIYTEITEKKEEKLLVYLPD